MPEYHPDENYINEVQQSGTPPETAGTVVANQVWFNLFKDFVDGQEDPELSAFGNAIDALEIKKLDPVTVWNSTNVAWSPETELFLKENAQTANVETLKVQMIKDATTKLEEIYVKEFLPLVKDINSGALNADVYDDMDRHIDNLLNEIADVVKKESDVNHLTDKLRPEDFGTTKDELGVLLQNLTKFDMSSDLKIKNDFRQSVKLDQDELNKLLDDLIEETKSTVPLNEELDQLLRELGNATKDTPNKDVINFIDIDDFRANEQDLDELLTEVENYAKSGLKDDDLLDLRGSIKVSQEDIQRLLDEVLDDGGNLKVVPIDPQLDQKINKLLEELVESAPNPSVRPDLLKNVAPQNLEMNDDEFINFIDNMVELSKAEDKKIRRSIHMGVSPEDIDRLINELENFDMGDDRPPAVSAADWDAGWVNQTNGKHIKDAPAGKPIAVVANGEYVLIGDEWNGSDQTLAGYRNSLTPAWRGERGYPGATGVTEIGQVVVEKSSGVFNVGKVIVNGITSARNRQGIEASVKSESKKKVVFND